MTHPSDDLTHHRSSTRNHLRQRAIATLTSNAVAVEDRSYPRPSRPSPPSAVLGWMCVLRIMNGTHTEDQTYSGIDFAKEPLPPGQYELCTFIRCTFTRADLSKRSFLECTFTNCDLSMARTTGISIRECVFSDCKLLGLSFDHGQTSLFAAAFTDCILDACSFQGMALQRTTFKGCRMHGTDFTRADLSGVAFDRCDLSDAVFADCDLQRADFRTAQGFTIDPEQNRMKGARFTVEGLPGLLAKHGLRIEH